MDFGLKNHPGPDRFDSVERKPVLSAGEGKRKRKALVDSRNRKRLCGVEDRE